MESRFTALSGVPSSIKEGCVMFLFCSPPQPPPTPRLTRLCFFGAAGQAVFSTSCFSCSPCLAERERELSDSSELLPTDGLTLTPFLTHCKLALVLLMQRLSGPIGPLNQFYSPPPSPSPPSLNITLPTSSSFWEWAAVSPNTVHQMPGSKWDNNQTVLRGRDRHGQTNESVCFHWNTLHVQMRWHLIPDIIVKRVSSCGL